MTTTQKLIAAFWVVILLTAAYQFYSYNYALSHPDKPVAHQEHFFFYPPGSHPPGETPPAPVASPDADVRQTGFSVDMDSPSSGNFTCHVTLKNFGSSKAINVQVLVRPYRGVSNYDDDASQQHVIVLPEDDPLSQLGTFLSFPDLDPGESVTRDSVFLTQDRFRPGKNPDPKIIFETDKSTASPPRRNASGGGD